MLSLVAAGRIRMRALPLNIMLRHHEACMERVKELFNVIARAMDANPTLVAWMRCTSTEIVIETVKDL